MDGWVKLFRKFTTWEWYADPNTKAMFIHCLLKANIDAGVWRGIHYDAGEFITSLPSLCEDLGLTMRQARTALSRLQATGEVTSRTTDTTTGKKMSKGRIITVNNWSSYQVNDSQNDRQKDRQVTGETTGKRQASDNRIRRKEDKEEKNNNICAKNRTESTKSTSVNSIFEQAWKLYPEKKGKGRVSDKDKRKLAEIGLEHFTRALERYKKEVESSSFKQYQNGSTFFHSGYIDYLDENYSPSVEKSHKDQTEYIERMPMYQEFSNEPVHEAAKSPFKGSLTAELLRRKQEGKLGA